MAKALAQFTIVRTGEDYLLTLEDNDGESTEFTLDEDQFDLMVEAIEDQLDSDDTDDTDADEGDEDGDEDQDDDDQ